MKKNRNLLSAKALGLPGRVIVARSFGVAESFQNGVALQQHILDTIDIRAFSTDCSDVLHDNLGGLGLSGAALTRDDHDLIATFFHGSVHLIGGSVNVRGTLVQMSTCIITNLVL
jgi:hypothetical protein